MSHPLLDRIVKGRTDLVFDWVADGMPADATDPSGVSLLQWSAYYGDVSAIQFLTRQGVPLEKLGPNYDLNGAAFHGHWRLVQFLLEQGADPNLSLADTGETPLHAATSHANQPHYEHVVKVLLVHGADPNAKTKPGIETGCFMRDARTRGETPLHRAAAFGTHEMVRVLLFAGADKEIQDANNDTPLAWSQCGYLAIAVLWAAPHHRQTRRALHQQCRPRVGWNATESVG